MRKHKLGIYEKALPKNISWQDRLSIAKTCGFDFVEISIDETDERLARLDWSKEERIKLVKAIINTGVTIPSMCLSGHRRFPFGSHDEATRQKSYEIMEKAIQLAVDLGIRTIQLAGYDVYYEQGDERTRKLFLEQLIDAVHFAGQAGVMLGFETMETPFMDTVAKAMAYVRAADSPYLGVYPDLGNLTNAAALYGTTVHEDLESGYGHLIAMHLKETIPGHYREVPFGTGHVDFTAGIATAWRLGVRRFVTELWDTGSGDWRGAVIQANTMMRRILDAQP